MKPKLRLIKGAGKKPKSKRPKVHVVRIHQQRGTVRTAVRVGGEEE